MSKQWLLAGGIVAGLALGGFALTSAHDGGVSALYPDARARGFRFAAVSIAEGRSVKVRKVAGELGLTFDILHDRSGAIQGTYQTTGVPESFLIDRDGRIVRRLIGNHDWNSPANRDQIDRLLATGS